MYLVLYIFKLLIFKWDIRLMNVTYEKLINLLKSKMDKARNKIQKAKTNGHSFYKLFGISLSRSFHFSVCKFALM